MTNPDPSPQPSQTHPRGLYTLFFTEMWERFSYYGMRAVLVLFMVDSVRGGMGLTDGVATAIYGLYTAGVYLAALPGGWVADRMFGAQRTVWYGGWIIAAGHYTLAIPRAETFYLGLVLVVLGTGLLKPNVSAIVGGLYPEGGARRDAGFTIFYMGINLGALIGPLVCSALGEKMNWHYGFGAAGIGMTCGLIQYRITRHHLGDAGAQPIHSRSSLRDRALFGGGIALILALIAAVALGLLKIDPIALARGTTYVIVGLAAVYFFSVLVFQRLTSDEKHRVAVIAVLFVASALFWSGFEQAGSSLTLFAERYTLRNLFGFEIPAGYFQMINPGFIIVLAPVVAATWTLLARRGVQPSMPVKFALGLLLLGGGFLVVAAGAKIALQGEHVWPTWLLATYFLHSVGELCLSPVGLSSVTKLSPKRLVGQMMGLWFLATSLGNLIAGLMAGQVSGESAGQMPVRFVQVALLAGGAAAALFIMAKPIQRMMRGVQ